MRRARGSPATSARALLFSISLLLAPIGATVLLLPTASAQLPELPLVGSTSNVTSSPKQIALGVNTTFVRIPYMGVAYVEMTLEDLSRDSLFQPGVPVALNPQGYKQDAINVVLDWWGGTPRGWAAGLGISSAYLYGGQTVVDQLMVSNSGPIQDQIVRLNITATYIHDDGTVLTDGETLTFQVVPYYQGLVVISEFPSGPVGQYETVTIPVEVRNTGIYPDVFELNATAPPGFDANVPPRVYVEPLSSRFVNLTFITPKDKLYEFGKPATIFVNARSINDPGVVYTAVVPMQVQGAYIPSYWTPITLLALVCIGLLVANRRENAELRRLERGRPRYPTVTPRQAVMLAELKARDPERYKERKTELDAVYASRRQGYRASRRETLEAERAEIRAARAEVREERRRRKERAKLERKAAKLRAKKEGALRKEQRKKMRELEKQKAKLQAKRDKAAKKQAKLDAKAAKKQAKLDAKAAKKQAKLDAAEAKRRAKEEKAARRKSR